MALLIIPSPSFGQGTLVLEAPKARRWVAFSRTGVLGKSTVKGSPVLGAKNWMRSGFCC